MRKSTEKVLKELRTRLKLLYGQRLKRLVLYGSYARREETIGSDIDLIVVLDNFSDLWEEIQRTGEIASKISLKFGITPSLIPVRERDFQKRQSPLMLNIRKEGVVI